MAKKYKIEGEVVEQNKYYRVIKANRDGKFYIYSRYDDSVYSGDNYKIIGAAVLEDNDGMKFYSNYVNTQKYGQGGSIMQRMIIDSWETKVVDGKEQTVVTYHDEKEYKFVRYIDDQGNLYKKRNCKKLDKEQDLSL